LRNYKDSDYALNRYSQGIVYKFSDGIVEITLEDYLRDNPDKTEEDFAELKSMVESASAVCAGDAVIEEVVYDIGQKALNGSAGVEDTVEEIVKKAAIYLAE